MAAGGSQGIILLSKRKFEKFALAQPILDSESFDPTELFRVVGHEHNPVGAAAR